MPIEYVSQQHAVGIQRPGHDADLIKSIPVRFDEIENLTTGGTQFFFRPDDAGNRQRHRVATNSHIWSRQWRTGVRACAERVDMPIEEALRKRVGGVLLQREEECGPHRCTHGFKQRELHLREIIKSVIEQMRE